MNLKIQLKMKCNPFKLTAVALLFSSMLLAQKVEKKYNEKFYTNKDVEININASNADIEVTTWNKNEVEVNAYIEVEGLEKDEAEKYLENWNFEALGNKKTVKINASSNQFHAFGKDNFVFFNSNNNLPETIGFGKELDEDVIVIAEDGLPEILIPDIDFDALITPALDNLDFDFDKYDEDGDNYFIQWKDGVNDITIKSKEEWEKFKKTKEYKKYKKEKAKRKKELAKQLRELKKKKIDKKEIKKALAKARIEIKKLDKEKIRKDIAKARKALKNTRFNYYFSSDNNFTINDKKVKITKKIKIRVPKNATFNLNTRHCKVKLPKTKAVGKVSYGSFNADELNGGNLKIIGSPVTIQTLNACTLFLNNVQDAKITSASNMILNSNSSVIKIDNLIENSEVVDDFGELRIENVNRDYKKLFINLNSSVAKIKFNGLKKILKASFNKEGFSKYLTKKPTMFYGENRISSTGNFNITTEDNSIKIKGKYSKIDIEK
ncbi:hypothetical protein WH52_09790 [Tenacibaculum holothuriorum]|uniref:Adhesin domain-containing protein n=1 Tax=Tenacibaculum holothuriorum TaxID=1635173 RepID=A0A1Y2PB93_9FLAO|nr:hypothetical protein [Tenacibaculum holothuriorum]OSY87712.1 hypothetical protein WH52_09790 [Tenacibaculum holothuriorum]